MVPTKLTLSNFMCYRADGEPDGPRPLDFDGLHVVCLSGENGAGKSALLDAITWALWGEARMADDDLIAQGQSEMLVELEFRLGDLDYRVRRARQRGGTGKRGGQTPGKSQLDLQVRNGAGWKALSETGVRETQGAINDLLRMSYQTFINASFLLQGRADEFTARTPSERKEVLADILDLGEYEALALKAREQARGLADQLTGLRGSLEQLAGEADKAPFWRHEVEQAEARVLGLTARVAEAEAAAKAADEARAALEQKAEQRKLLLQRLDELRREREEREREIATLRARIQQDEAVLARRDAIRAGLDALAAARGEVEALEQAREQYDALSRAQAELRQQFTEARAELRQQLSAAEGRQAHLAQSAARRAQLGNELGALAAGIAALAPLAAERERRATERQGLVVRADQLDALQRRRDGLAAQIKQRLDSLVAVRENRREAVARLERQLADEPAWRRDLEAARADQLRLAQAEAELLHLRALEQAASDRQGEQRAGYQAAQAEGEKLKKSRALLDEGAAVCPVCRRDLGAHGVADVHRHYDDELHALRERYAAAKRAADAAAAELAQARDAVAAHERTLAPLRHSAAQVGALERQLAQAATWRQEADELRAQLDELRRQIEADEIEPGAQAELVIVEGQLAGLGDPRELAQERAMLEERLHELDQRLHERGLLEGKSAALGEELERIEKELAELPAVEAELAELRRVIATNDFAHAVRDEGKRVGEALERLGYSQERHAAAREAVAALAQWEKQERDLLLAEQRVSGDRANLAKSELLQRRADDEAERLTRADALLADELRRLPALSAQVAELQRALGEARTNLTVAQKDLGEKQGYLKHAEQAARALEEQRARERALVGRQGLFAELAEAFGKKGVQAMLIETAIPQIEDEANRLLGRMTDGQMHLSFDMQRDTKKGDTVETLEIKIADALGTRVYDAFSGGEAMRANFAVRIALSRLLARRAGARLETLVIDEGFGTLDALGRERMVEAITSVQDDFRRIIVITHIDELKERFPAQIEVTKTPLGSRWELR